MALMSEPVPTGRTLQTGADAALLGLYTHSSLHVGAGSSPGIVDLPIQREHHTGWPLVPGSSLKGTLRDLCRDGLKAQHNHSRRTADEKDPALLAAFGPARGDDASGFAGSLSVGDARLAAFPLRSLRGTFAWVSCPTALERLAIDLALIDGNAQAKLNVPLDLQPGQAKVGSACILKVNGKLVLEEFDYTIQSGCEEVDRAAKVLADLLLPQESAFATLQNNLPKRLVILHDDDFTHAVRHQTEVVTRIAMDYEKRTAADGALFFQECLPPQCVMYSVLLADLPRSGDRNLAADFEVIPFVAGHLPPVIQIGGDQSIGRGLCLTRLHRRGQS